MLEMLDALKVTVQYSMYYFRKPQQYFLLKFPLHPFLQSACFACPCLPVSVRLSLSASICLPFSVFFLYFVVSVCLYFLLYLSLSAYLCLCLPFLVSVYTFLCPFRPFVPVSLLLQEYLSLSLSPLSYMTLNPLWMCVHPGKCKAGQWALCPVPTPLPPLNTIRKIH